MKRILVAALALLMVAGLLVGCVKPTPPPVEQNTSLPEGEGTLRLSSGSDIEILSPHVYKASTTRTFLQMVSGALYRVVPSDKGTPYAIVPELADGDPQKMDDTGLLWQIKVHNDAKWANGEPLTAEDFEYSFRMLFDPLLLNHRATVLEESNVYVKNARQYHSQQSTEAVVEWEEVGINALDSQTLQVQLEQPVDVAAMKKCFSGSTTIPVYKPLYEDGMNAERTETNYGTTVERFMSSGPFVATLWAKDSEYHGQKNVNYLQKDQIWLHAIEFKVIPERGTAIQMFESGQLDHTSLDTASLEKYGDDDRVIRVPGSAVLCIGINGISENNPILQNRKFRQALYYGVDRIEIANLNKAVPATYFIPDVYTADIETGLEFRNTPEATAYLPANYGFDTDKALNLMQEALAETGLGSATFEIMYQDGNDSRKNVCEYLQAKWQEVFPGLVQVKLQAVPSSQLSEKLRDHITNPSSFEMGVIATSYNLLDPVSALSEWASHANRKKIPYYDETFTELYDQAVALALDDVQGRIKATADAEARLLYDAPMIPIMQTVAYEIVADRVTLPWTGDYNNVREHSWIYARIDK